MAGRERRGCFVMAEDPLVQEHVCQVIFRLAGIAQRSWNSSPSIPRRPAVDEGARQQAGRLVPDLQIATLAGLVRSSALRPEEWSRGGGAGRRSTWGGS